MNDETLQYLTETISDKYFHKPFVHKAVFNSRLRTTGGRYLLVSHNIEINRKYLEVFGESELVGIIKHELCHYHLHLESRGYRHKDEDFKQLLKKVNAPRFCTPLPNEMKSKRPVKIIQYRCRNCGEVYKRKRKIDTNRYVCGKCTGELKIEG